MDSEIAQICEREESQSIVALEGRVCLLERLTPRITNSNYNDVPQQKQEPDWKIIAAKRKAQKAAVLEYIRQHPGSTAREIAKVLGAEAKNIGNQLRSLEGKKLVEYQTEILRGIMIKQYYIQD